MPFSKIYALAVILSLNVVIAAEDQFSPIRKEVATIDLANKAPSQEHMEVFRGIYSEFIKNHQIDDEGEFISGAGIPDDAKSLAYFLNYVSRNPIIKIKTVSRRCPNCKGNSKIWVPTYPEKPLSLAKHEVDCPECPSNGHIQYEVSFTLMCPSKGVPPLPEKPRVTKQRLMVKAAMSGDSFAQVEYAKQLETGALGIGKNEGLAKDFFAKAFVGGNVFGLDGLIRMIEGGRQLDGKEKQMLFTFKLLQAQLEKGARSSEIFFGIYPDQLGVAAPADMSFMDAKIAEIEARSLYFNHKARETKSEHLTVIGLPNVLKPLKKQLEKGPMDTARSKVEYVLVSVALSAGSEEFGSGQLELAKQAAVSMDPCAFGILGDVCERGVLGKKKLQSASIFYSISKLLRSEKIISGRMDALESRYERGITAEMLGEFSRTKISGRANITYIDAVLKLEAQPLK